MRNCNNTSKILFTGSSVQTLTDMTARWPIFRSFAPRVGRVLKLIVTALRILPVNYRSMAQIANRQNLHV